MAAQRKIPQFMGFVPASPSNGVTTLSLNATATWLALGFVPDSSKTVARVRAFVSTVTGSLASTDVSCDLYSDSAGVPNASLVSSTTLTSAISAGAWGEWGGAGTGFNWAVTAGTQYWVVFKNLNGTPTSNFPAFRFGGGNNVLPFASAGSTVNYGWPKRHSTNSGTAWTAGNVSAGALIRVEYTDGTFDGFPIQNVAANTTDSVYSARETGVKLTTPPGPSLKVRGAMFVAFIGAGAPTGDLRARLYNGTTLLATSAIAPKGNVTGSVSWFPFYFSASQTIAPGTTLRVTLGETTQSDTSSNRYHTYEYTFDSDSNSLALLPFEGTAQKTYTTDGSTFTDTSSVLIPFALILDTDGEFSVSGGGGALIRVGFNGGING